MKRRPAWTVIVGLGAAMLTVVATFVVTPRSPRSALAATPATLSIPNARCNSDTATVAFSWAPVDAATQVWIDLSLLDDGFEAGTFVGAGPLVGSATSFEWAGITKGLPHLWRINAFTAVGWVTSATGAFVPCGSSPALLYGPLNCTSSTTAAVDFRWAPMASPHQVQYVDLGFDPSFAPGSFVGAGPITASEQGYHWEGLQGNVPYVFRVNEQSIDGSWHSSPVAGFTTPCAPEVRKDLYASDDRLVIPVIGVNAPVNVRDVDFNGEMGNPAGPEDVVRYNFPVMPEYGGYPGFGGTTILAGHVDYRNYGPAVFARIRDLQPGDTIEYYRWDGAKVRYQVDWSESLYGDADWNSLARATNPESIELITCEGTFDPVARAYDQRRVVHGVRVY